MSEILLPRFHLFRSGMLVSQSATTDRKGAAAAHRWGILGIVLALFGGTVAALLISHQAQRKSQGMERVEEGLSAIAKGELDRRIELGSSDDARAIADNINVMTERMRAQIAREEETQAVSVVRADYSAMLIPRSQKLHRGIVTDCWQHGTSLRQ